MSGTLEYYLNYLHDQGPSARAFTMKAAGAEQDDEEKPTTARTKRFERDEAKVGVVEFGGNAQLAATPVSNLGSEPLEGGHSDVVGRMNKKYKEENDDDDDDENEDKIDRALKVQEITGEVGARIAAQVGTSVAGYGSAIALARRRKRKICQQKYGNDQRAIEVCMRGGR